MKKLKQKLSKAKSISKVLEVMLAAPSKSPERWKALQKMRAVVRERLASAKTERRCMKILSSVPMCSAFEHEFRSVAVRNMLAMHTFSACKCACIIAKPDSALAISALSGMLANAKTVEELEIVTRLAQGPIADFIKREAEVRAYKLRGSL